MPQPTAQQAADVKQELIQLMLDLMSKSQHEALQQRIREKWDKAIQGKMTNTFLSHN